GRHGLGRVGPPVVADQHDLASHAGRPPRHQDGQEVHPAVGGGHRVGDAAPAVDAAPGDDLLHVGARRGHFRRAAQRGPHPGQRRPLGALHLVLADQGEVSPRPKGLHLQPWPLLPGALGGELVRLALEGVLGALAGAALRLEQRPDLVGAVAAPRGQGQGLGQAGGVPGGEALVVRPSSIDGRLRILILEISSKIHENSGVPLPPTHEELRNSTRQSKMDGPLDSVDGLFARISGAGTAAWDLLDRLGSVRDLTDNTGAVQDTVSYNGFGNVVSESSTAFGDRFKYTARELDSETGLQYNRARYYDPRTGRWTTEDSLGFGAGDSNLYRSVHNNPTNLVDPSGLIRQPPFGELDVSKRTKANEPAYDWSRKLADRVIPFGGGWATISITGDFWKFTDKQGQLQSWAWVE